MHGLFQGNDDKFRIKLNVTVAQIRQRVEVVPSLELNDRKHLQAIAIHPVRSREMPSASHISNLRLGPCGGNLQLMTGRQWEDPNRRKSHVHH